MGSLSPRGAIEQRPLRWVGPVVSIIAMLVSVGILVRTLMSRHDVGEPPEFVRLGPVTLGSLVDELDAATERLPLRVSAASLAASTAHRARLLTTDMLDARAVPTQVHYTVARGGTLENVANRFGIYHHEITALNPGIGLKQELAPGTRVVVWRSDPEVKSASIGKPSAGQLEGAVPMLEGPGRELRPHRVKLWGTAGTVARLDWVLRQWKARYPEHHDILVGNLSYRRGGKVEPHRTHQSGRDVDLSFIQRWDGIAPVTWQNMDALNFDPKGNWLLIELLAETGSLAVVFVDYSLQKLLYDYALETGRYSEAELAQWMQYPQGQNTRGRIIQHAPGHVDHIHVRFACSPSDTRCQEDEH